MSIEQVWKAYLAKVKSRPVEAYDANAYDELREAAYAQLFGGTATHVVQEPIPTPPFVVGVHLFNAPPPHGAPTIIMPGPLRGQPLSRAAPEPRNWTTLATMGMSNERMLLPPGAPPEMARIELLFHISWNALAATPDLIHFCADMLLYFAKYPFLEDRFLAPGHVVPVCVIGQGPVRFLGDDHVSRLLVLPAPHGLPGADLSEQLQLAGDRVSFLTLIPISEQELELIRSQGVVGFLEQAELPGIYDGPRPSCV